MSETILLAEKIAGDIEQWIGEGVFTPGDKLPSEGELTERLGIGRSTLREATKILKTKKVLESRRGVGTFVCQDMQGKEPTFSLGDVEKTLKSQLNLLEIRLLLEPEAAAMAAVNASEEQIMRLQKQCSAVEALMNANQDYGRADSLLHQMIAEYSGNVILSRLVAVIASSHFMSISSSDDECREVSLHYHRAIVDSIAHRDVQGARYNMVNHINYNRSFLMENQ